MGRDVVEETTEIKLAWVGFRKVVLRIRGEPAARNDHTIQRVSAGPEDESGLGVNRAHDKPGLRIDGNGFIRIVKSGIEKDHISPQSVIGNNDRVTKTVVDGQILPELPGVLSEALIHVGAKD